MVSDSNYPDDDFNYLSNLLLNLREGWLKPHEIDIRGSQELQKLWGDNWLTRAILMAEKPVL